MSVFVKHAEEIKTYESTGGVERGRLLFAMAILSDCQEMVGKGDISEEINEAKELIISVMKNLEPFSDLWGCHETIRDGEAEYGSDFLVKAGTMEKAERKAWEITRANYLGDDDTGLLNEDGWMELESDYRLVKASVSRQIHNTDELLQFVGYYR